MKKKSILKTCLLFGGIALFCLNLVSCNNTKKEFIEVGLGSTQNGMVQSIYDSFYTGLKVKTESNSIQEVEIFNWNRIVLGSNDILHNAEVDKEQNLEFKLYREVYKYGNYKEESKSTEICSFTNTLEYFFSEEFSRHNPKSIIDTISVDDLYDDYIDYAGVRYYFTIIPVEEDEPIKIYQPFNEMLKLVYENGIKSHCTGIEYKINSKNEITFIESEEIRKENINV